MTPGTRRALGRAREAGIEVVIATGRRYRSTCRVIEALELPVRAVVLGGALVKDGDGSTLRAEHIDPGDFRRLYQIARGLGHTVVCHRDSATHGGPDFVLDGAGSWNEATVRYFESNREFAELGDDLEAGGCPEALVMGAFGSEEDLRDLDREIQHAHPGRFFTNMIPTHTTGSWYFELVPHGVSKWTGICAVAAHCDIPIEQVCAVGDQTNDLPMIRAARWGVAMGNAPQVVKAEADWVTRPCDEDGIALVVERLLDEW